MQCMAWQMLNDSTELTDDDPFSTHSALEDALAREGAAPVVGP